MRRWFCNILNRLYSMYFYLSYIRFDSSCTLLPLTHDDVNAEIASGYWACGSLYKVIDSRFLCSYYIYGQDSMVARALLKSFWVNCCYISKNGKLLYFGLDYLAASNYSDSFCRIHLTKSYQLVIEATTYSALILCSYYNSEYCPYFLDHVNVYEWETMPMNSLNLDVL